jgi:dihydroorotate dehydrogenase (NAD+) catalytic subunit
LRPIGLRAVRAARGGTHLPLCGVGGVLAAEDAVAYARAGATLVQIGTASFAAPRASLQVTRDLRRWGRAHDVAAWSDLVAPPGVAAPSSAASSPLAAG